MPIVLPLLIKNAFGYVVANGRWFAYGFAALLLLLLIVFAYRGCSKREVKLNEAEIQAGEKAVKDRNDAELRKILVESEAREAVIDANVANAKAETINAKIESQKKWANSNISELQAEFDKRKNQ